MIILEEDLTDYEKICSEFGPIKAQESYIEYRKLKEQERLKDLVRQLGSLLNPFSLNEEIPGIKKLDGPPGMVFYPSII